VAFAINRRRLLVGAAALCCGGAIARPAAAGPGEGLTQSILKARGETRSLTLFSVNTGEKVAVDYWVEGRYQSEALEAVCEVMRDRRSNEVTDVSPQLLDLLYAVQRKLDTRVPIEVVCGYRSPTTNAQLAKTNGAVAQNSYHTRGMAVDVRMQGRTPRQIQKAGLALNVGGVGLYSRSGFVHLDVGPPRSW